MITIGLTGGIGSGKSTVASMLAERGAIVVDADVIAREVVEPGREAWSKVKERFGEGVLSPDGSIDRAALAAVVFADESARVDLNGIIHPEVGKAMLEQVAAEAASDHIVVLDIPLLAEGGRDRYGVAGVLVVDVPVELAIERLVSERGMERADAEARIAAQMSREDRVKIADFIILNIGSLAELSQMVDRAWGWMVGLRAEQAEPDQPEG